MKLDREIMKKLIIAFFLCSLTYIAQAQEMTANEKTTLEQRIREQIDDFISYLPEIAGKSGKPQDEKKLALKYINSALELFIGKGDQYSYIDQNGNKRLHEAVKMQTTSRGVANRPKPMKRYLSGLINLPYQKVEVDKCSAVRINKHLYKISEGKYAATAVYLQAFRAWRDGKLIINDKDAKQVTVYVDKKVIDTPNGSKTYWEIQLGDIRITSDWGE